MILMTGKEFRDYCVTLFKRTDKDVEIYQAITDSVIDARNRYSFDQFCNEAYTGALATLGDYRLDLPTELGNFIGTVRIVGSTEYPPLIKLSKPQFDRLFPNQEDTTYRSTPRYFCYFGNQLLLAPVPDDISLEYEINYSEELFYEFTGTDLTATVPFSDNYREVLRFGVLFRLYAGLDNESEMLKWQSLYERGLAQIIKRDYANTHATGFIEFNDL